MLPHQKQFAYGATAVFALHAVVLGLQYAAKKRRGEFEYVHVCSMHSKLTGIFRTYHVQSCFLSLPGLQSRSQTGLWPIANPSKTQSFLHRKK